MKIKQTPLNFGIYSFTIFNILHAHLHTPLLQNRKIYYILFFKWSHYCNYFFSCLLCKKGRNNMLLSIVFLLPSIISSTGRQKLSDNTYFYGFSVNVAKLYLWQLYQFINPQAIVRGSFPFILNKTASYRFLRIFAILTGLISLIFLYLHF